MSNPSKQGSVKKGPQRWLHPSSSLVKGSIIYDVKFWGFCQVPEPTGAVVVRTAIEKLKLQHQVQKQQGFKTLRVKLAISYRGLRVQDGKTKAVLHQHQLSNISYAGDDKSDKSLFAYIAAEGKQSKIFRCYIFDTDKFAMQISLTVAQAFHLAFKHFEDEVGPEKAKLAKKLPALQRQSIDEPAEPQTPAAVPVQPAATAVAPVPVAAPVEARAAAPAAAPKTEEPAKPAAAPASEGQEASEAATGADQPVSYFEPFDFNTENELPAPVFGPGIEDIDGAIKHIEEQLASLEEGFEMGFTIGEGPLPSVKPT